MYGSSQQHGQCHLMQKNTSLSCIGLTLTSALFSFSSLPLTFSQPYVIMLAGAKDISEGGVALVFIANVLPSLLVKLTAPCWFHLVSYGTRILSCSVLMMLAFCTVSFFAHQSDMHSKDSDDTGRISRAAAFELLGVMFGSFHGGLGEVSRSELSDFFP